MLSTIISGLETLLRQKDSLDSYISDPEIASKISHFADSSFEIRQRIFDIRKNVLEQVKKKRAWVYEELYKELLKDEINPYSNLCGILSIQLLDLKKLINAATEVKGQRTLDFGKDIKQEQIIQKDGKYRYKLNYNIDRWEARAVFSKGKEFWDTTKLKKLYETRDLRLEETSEKQRSIIVTFILKSCMPKL